MVAERTVYMYQSTQGYFQLVNSAQTYGILEDIEVYVYLYLLYLYLYTHVHILTGLTAYIL
jgi:hypothetical protein